MAEHGEGEGGIRVMGKLYKKPCTWLLVGLIAACLIAPSANADVLTGHDARSKIRHSAYKTGQIYKCKRLATSRIRCWVDVAFEVISEGEGHREVEYIMSEFRADVGLKGVRWLEWGEG